MSAVDPLAPQLAPSASESLDAEHDGRSSSLSDVGDHATDERGESKFGANDDAEANDTEAETERLENTPLKRRKHQNVVLTAESREYSSRTSPSQATVLSMFVLRLSALFLCLLLTHLRQSITTDLRHQLARGFK